ncbi:MAG: citrate synthase [Thermoleophilia bacterium]|nr:citrate synthase [Thermoleophilia bacterium]
MTDAKAGLEGIVVARSELCSIDGQKGILGFRGYDIHELARHATYEEVAFLLLRGELPSAAELAAFAAELGEARAVSGEAAQVVDLIARDAAPMEMLRTAVSATSFDDPDKDSNSEEANQRKAIRLLAKIPTLVCRYHRRRAGLEPVDPDPELSYAESFLTMLSGRPPDEDAARTFDVAMILHADHEMNASTFTARVIASTLADMHSAVVGAIGALKGPLHGGANEQVMRTLESIDDPDRVEDDIRRRLAGHERIMGFGHRVYKTMDPRAEILKELARRLAGRADGSEPDWFAMSERIERVVTAEKGLYPNVDFYSASTYRYLGIPTELFTTLFVASRVVGWAAHVIEQHRDNRLIRPSSLYVGPDSREYPARDGAS